MAKFAIDQEAIAALADLMEAKGLTELSLTQGDHSISLSRAQQALAPIMQAAPVAMAAPAVSSAAADTTPAAQLAGAITSPMVGTVYLSPQPGAAPFIAVGDSVKQGQTLLIIEAMKVMNPITAPKAGRVSAILIGDSQPVEFGEALVVVE